MPRSEFDWAVLEREFQEATTLPGAKAGDSGWWDKWHAHLAARTSPRWFYALEAAPAWFNTHWPALTKIWLARGEELLDDLVHAGEYRPERLPDGEIDWGANPTKSMSWAGFHYWSWPNPWIRAYGLSGDERYPAELARHLRSYFEQLDSFTPELWPGPDPDSRDWRDWITHNPLSAGIKMATFAEAVMVFRRAASWTADDLRRATLLLVRLARRTYDDHHTGFDAAFLGARNFLTSGAAGLGVVAAIFPECEWAPAWERLALDIIETHVMDMYYADGGHRELCTQYHKAGLRDILFYEHVLGAQGRGYFLAREPYRAAICRALKWLAAILLPDGSTAVLNSAAAADDWLVFFVAANRELRDPELAWHVNRWFSPDYLPRQKCIPSLGVRILGQEDAPDPAIPAAPPQECSALLPESGVAVLRSSWERDANVMILDLGRPVGGHAYPARGCFVLYLRGLPAAMSPGSPHAYTDPDYDGWMNTSLSQNNVLIDDLDQEMCVSPGRRRVHGEITHWEANADDAVVQGRHDGYLANAGIVHTRTVRMVDDRFFLVHDVLDATAAASDHVVKWSIHCPDQLEEVEDRVVVANGLMRVTPAWPSKITGIEIGARGKAVWPENAADCRTDVHRRLHHARWHQPIVAGGTAQFLMLVQPDDEVGRITAAELDGEHLQVKVEVGSYQATIALPRPPQS